MDTRTFDALTESMKSAYVAGLSEGAVPRPVIMPLVRGELVGLIWLRPVTSAEDALTAIASLSNIAAAANADEIVLAWETQDVATTCELPSDGRRPASTWCTPRRTATHSTNSRTPRTRHRPNHTGCRSPLPGPTGS